MMAQFASSHRTYDCTIREPSGSAALSSSPACSDDIPTVDFDVLVNGTADQRLGAVRDLGRACEDWGFFTVINHGVPETLREALMDACKDLFDLPAKEKAEYMDAGPMDPIRIGSGFNSSDEAVYQRDYVKMVAHPEFHCPSKPAELSGIAREYAACTRALALELVEAISESLGHRSSRISEALRLDSCFQVLVGNLYPPCTRAGSGAMGLPAHSDHGLLTLLFQNGVDGLEIKHSSHWVPVKPLPNSFLVITGDQLEIASNGRYKGVVHRAVVGGERTRMSSVSLIGPSLDTVVEPIPELAGDSQGLEFRGIKYGEYMLYQQSSKLKEKEALDIVRVHGTCPK